MLFNSARIRPVVANDYRQLANPYFFAITREKPVCFLRSFCKFFPLSFLIKTLYIHEE